MKQSLFGLVIAGALLAAGCSTADTQQISTDAGKLGQSLNQSLTNTTLSGKVLAHMSLRKRIDPAGIRVEVKGATVTLTGSVKTSEERELAATVARETKGVDFVDNKLEVRP